MRESAQRQARRERARSFMQSALISAILVSFNTRELTLRALEMLERAAKGLDVEVWVVDNASIDDSAGAIRARFPDVNVIEAGANLGFGAANNRAMARARGQYFLLLNTDAFVEADALSELLAAAHRHPRAAVLAPRILNADGSRQKSIWPFPTPRNSWSENTGLGWFMRRFAPQLCQNPSPDEEGEVPWATGACLLVRRVVYEQVGGFDEKFWMYAEETDWQKIMRQAGWNIVFAPRAVVTHLGGASGAGSTRVAVEFFRSQERYTRKHHGAPGLFAARAALLLGQLTRLPFFSLRVLLTPRNERARAKLKLARWLVRRCVRESVSDCG